MTEEDARSGSATVHRLDPGSEATSVEREILDGLTHPGSEFSADKRDKHGEADHAFETYLADHDINHTQCIVGRPQSNGTIDRFSQTYESQRWRFE